MVNCTSEVVDAFDLDNFLLLFGASLEPVAPRTVVTACQGEHISDEEV